jgi:DNA-directed RNA polymerase specialized sigma24 family protein
MQTLEQAKKGAADLYWLAYLLTGQREASVDVTVEALESQDGGNSFFSTWMLAWARRMVIAKALDVIHDELARSARRTASRRVDKTTLPPRNWTPDRDATKVQLERALLAIDVFPRCAVVLTVFERMSLEDAAILLDGDREMVRKAQTIGLQELTRNLARMQGWRSSATNSYVVMSEMQHA